MAWAHSHAGTSPNSNELRDRLAEELQGLLASVARPAANGGDKASPTEAWFIITEPMQVDSPTLRPAENVVAERTSTPPEGAPATPDPLLTNEGRQDAIDEKLAEGAPPPGNEAVPDESAGDGGPNDAEESRAKVEGGVPHPLEAEALSLSTWRDLEVWFLSSETVQLTIKGKKGPRLNCAELGFEDRRTGKAAGGWSILQKLAEADGMLRGFQHPERVKQHVRRIRKVLRAYLEGHGILIPTDELLPYVRLTIGVVSLTRIHQ